MKDLKEVAEEKANKYSYVEYDGRSVISKTIAIECMIELATYQHDVTIEKSIIEINKLSPVHISMQGRKDLITAIKKLKP